MSCISTASLCSDCAHPPPSSPLLPLTILVQLSALHGEVLASIGSKSFPVDKVLQLVKAAGIDIIAFLAAGCSWVDVKTAGFTAAESKAAGCDAASAHSAGYDELSLSQEYGYVSHAAAECDGPVTKTMADDSTAPDIVAHVPAAHTPPSASLYVGDLAKDVREEHLFEIFSVVGPIDSIRVLRHHISRVSLGYAYVNFSSVRDAERAFETLNYYSLKGRPIRIMWKQRDPSMRKSGAGNIFIKNIDTSVTSRDLLDTFSQFGNVLSCKVATSNDGKSKGFGFVQYQTREEAERAVNSTNGQKLTPAQSVALVVDHYVPPEKRRPLGPRMMHGQSSACPWNTPFMGHAHKSALPPCSQLASGPAKALDPVCLGELGQPQAVFIQQARNVPSDAHVASVSAAPVQNKTDLATMLAQASAEQQKQMLGERLYLLIIPTQPHLAGKITGMLLDGLDTSELLGLIDSPIALDEKIQLALRALQKH